MKQQLLTGCRQAYQLYRRPEIFTMFFLGFSAGLPFLLIFSTLGARLRMAGIDVLTIGYFSWIGVLYSIKIFWAPIVDQVHLPLLTFWLGQRRSWLLCAQLMILTGLLIIAFIPPQSQIEFLAFAAIWVAFGAATQDIAIDAFRIESALPKFQGAMASMYIMGYRIGLLTASAGALSIAGFWSWQVSYCAMAALMWIGIICVILRPEPQRLHQQHAFLYNSYVRKIIKQTKNWPAIIRKLTVWLHGVIVCPIQDFFHRFGHFSLLLLIFIGIFRISDIAMAAMANPLYIDLGFSAATIGMVSGAFGLLMTLCGGFIGGLLVAANGIKRLLGYAAILTASTNLLFSLLALTQHNIFMLVVTITADNFANGVASTILIAFLSSLTSQHYTATQYALFSSLMTLPGKLIGGFSGQLVDATTYPAFFIIVAILGIPAILIGFYIGFSQPLKSLP